MSRSHILSGFSLAGVFGGAKRAAAGLTHDEESRAFERFIDGDDQAAVGLFHRYNSRLFLYCSKLLGDTEQAEDVTQEVWERVIRMRSNPRPVRNPAGFLFRIARNLCLNQLKSRKRTIPLSSIDDVDHPSCTMHGASEMEELVLTALDSLRFEDRELLVLNIYCGYRLDEIATMMDLKPNAVWTRASRARAQLRKIVAKSIEEDAPDSNSRNSTEDRSR